MDTKGGKPRGGGGGGVMNWVIGIDKLRPRCREQTYGHQGGKTTGEWGWRCDELGDWDCDVYKIDD